MTSSHKTLTAFQWQTLGWILRRVWALSKQLAVCSCMFHLLPGAGRRRGGANVTPLEKAKPPECGKSPEEDELKASLDVKGGRRGRFFHMEIAGCACHARPHRLLPIITFHSISPPKLNCNCHTIGVTSQFTGLLVYKQLL